MKDLDLQYICTVIGNLSGIPIRIFQNDKQVFYYSLAELPKDPIIVYWDRIRDIPSHVGYMTTHHFSYYGVVNSGPFKIVLGPSRQILNSDQELKELAFRANVPLKEVMEFVSGMRSIVCMSLESMLQILCMMNYLLNGEKISLADITLDGTEQERLTPNADEKGENRSRKTLWDIQNRACNHNTLKTEREIVGFVRKGDCEALKQWVSSAPAVHSGVMARDQLRQIKNTFIVTGTIVCRAAIQGGMDPQDALALADLFIQKCELLTAPDQVTNLMFQMVLEYTQRVNQLNLGENPTNLKRRVATYIKKHLSEPITAEDIACELYISRPYLSHRFKEETGETITNFILRVKTNEAKELLHYTENTITSIGLYLGFSSQSHFSSAFKKCTGYTPKEYRLKCNQE